MNKQIQDMLAELESEPELIPFLKKARELVHETGMPEDVLVKITKLVYLAKKSTELVLDVLLEDDCDEYGVPWLINTFYCVLLNKCPELIEVRRTFDDGNTWLLVDDVEEETAHA
jgi:hypothetical protein